MDSPASGGGVIGSVPCIKPIVTGHFKIPLRDMLDEEFYEINGRDGLLDKNIVLMSVVVESDIIPVIGVDTGKCNDRAAQVAADIFDDGTRIGKGGLCIDIKAVLIFAVDKSLGLFKGGSDPFFHFRQQDRLESPAQVSIVEMFFSPPESFVREAAFCDEAVDVGVPFQGPAKGMEDADKARDKVFGLIDFIKHVGDNNADSLEKAVKEGAVFQEEMP